jgi:hypothetical protein
MGQNGWDVSNPTAYWRPRQSAYSNRKPPRSNKYLLHPLLPVDVRLPALIGIGGVGFYIYLEQTGRLEQAATWASECQKSANASIRTSRQVIERVSRLEWPFERATSYQPQAIQETDVHFEDHIASNSSDEYRKAEGASLPPDIHGNCSG